MEDEVRNELQSAAPAEETPQEVVLCYTAPETAREAVELYVHPEPLPGRAAPARASAPDTSVWKEAARKAKRRRRTIGWIACAAVVLIAGAVTLAVLPKKSAPADPDVPGGDDNSASSIVDIWNDSGTSIPRYRGEGSARLTVDTEAAEALTPQEVYAKANPAVVTVITEVGGDTGKVGTGVIMTPDGYVVTNAHVISEGKKCAVVLDTGVMYEAELVGYDTACDLAVLHAVDAQDLPTAEFADSDRLTVGDTAYAIGNPLGVELRGTFTEGMISAVNREVSVQGGGIMTMIQTTAALNSGNSGGPLIDSAGRVVGINTMKMSNTRWEEEATVEGLGFAIPISSAVFAVNDIIQSGEFHGTPMLGISVITQDRADGNGTELVVYSVEKGLGAEQAGVAEGDVITAADGVAVDETLDLLAVRRNYLVGGTMHLTLQRGGETLEVDVTLMSAE